MWFHCLRGLVSMVTELAFYLWRCSNSVAIDLKLIWNLWPDIRTYAVLGCHGNTVSDWVFAPHAVSIADDFEVWIKLLFFVFEIWWGGQFLLGISSSHSHLLNPPPLTQWTNRSSVGVTTPEVCYTSSLSTLSKLIYLNCSVFRMRHKTDVPCTCECLCQRQIRDPTQGVNV